MQTIYLDISNKGVIPTIYAKQGDVGRRFQVVLTDSGVPYVPTSGSAFSVWYSGASGEGNYTDVGDKSAFSVNGNKVAVEMIAQMLSNDGDGILSLVLNDPNGNQVSTWNIPYCCESVPGAESEKAESYYTAFSQAVENLPYPDTSLSVAGKAADSAAVGVALAGKAPSGYGLGEHPSTVITNPDTITKSGFYKAVCTFSEYYKDITAWVEMIASSENYATQHAYFDMHEGVKLTRYKIAGVWQPWEWNNPPMDIGIEFRTTERWNGKVVYTQAFNAGAMVNSSYASYPVNNLKYIIRGSAMLSNGTCLPFDVHGPSGSNFATVYFAQYEMWMHCGSSQTGKTVYAQIWYIKEELA
jgi:hypothetical protein